MWLSSSSVGRKFIMALTGAALVLFVTFHCLMNAVAICWPTAYNSVCMFLGANWYALLASAGLALLIFIHIIYAVILTLQNRKARGSQRYSISHKPKTVEWSSQNMLVLGIVILAFLVVHMIQFWAKMQLQEIIGGEESIPPVAGTLFIQEAFSQPWTIIVYVIGFIALWFHLNHGFWSMFQSVGWDNTTWIPRLKCIGAWWVGIVIVLFLAEAIVFTVRANEDYYKTDPQLREQYKDMIMPMIEQDFGPDADQLGFQIQMTPYEQVSMGLRQMESQMEQQAKMFESPEAQAQINGNPDLAKQAKELKGKSGAMKRVVGFLDYLEGSESQVTEEIPQIH